MTELDPPELDCLETIARGLSDMTRPCADHTLQRLLSRGLIEPAPGIWLPLEMKRDSYRLTAAGRAVLQNRKPTGQI